MQSRQSIGYYIPYWHSNNRGRSERFQPLEGCVAFVFQPGRRYWPLLTTHKMVDTSTGWHAAHILSIHQSNHSEALPPGRWGQLSGLIYPALPNILALSYQMGPNYPYFSTIQNYLILNRKKSISTANTYTL